MAQPATWPVDRFRETLDRILGETRLPQAGLAALVPIDQSQLSRWKSGSSRPSFDSLKTLGEALRAKYPSIEIGPNELLEAAGYAPPEPVSRNTQAHTSTPAPPQEAGPSVTISSGTSPPLTVIVNENDLDTDPRDTEVGELNDQFERTVWSFSDQPVGIRVAAIIGYRRGLEAIGRPPPGNNTQAVAEPNRPPRGA